MSQVIKRKSDILCDAEIKLVSLNKFGKPVKLPKVLINKLNKLLNFFEKLSHLFFVYSASIHISWTWVVTAH